MDKISPKSSAGAQPAGTSFAWIFDRRALRFQLDVVKMVKRIAVVSVSIGALASCTPTKRGTAIGAGTGPLSAEPSPTT